MFEAVIFVSIILTSILLLPNLSEFRDRSPLSCNSFWSERWAWWLYMGSYGGLMSIAFLLRKQMAQFSENCYCVMDDATKWNWFDVFFIALPVQESGEETS